jgi:hypothetical protein
VSVRATRRPLAEEGDDAIVDERPHGEFSRQLFLGENLDAGKLTAHLDEGVLTLEIPVAEASKPRRCRSRIDLYRHQRPPVRPPTRGNERRSHGEPGARSGCRLTAW